jgi:hypothetical protein
MQGKDVPVKEICRTKDGKGLTEIYRTMGGTVIWLIGPVTEIRGTSDGTVLQWSEQTEICRTKEGTLHRYSGLVTEIFRTGDGTVV